MSLEQATYIHQLLETNPTTQDKLKQGDDHIRQIKKVLKNNFPALTGALTVSQEVLNQVPAKLVEIIVELIKHTTRKGCIVGHDPQMPVPTGWALCNGSVVSGYGTTPDLRNQFIKGWNGTTNGGDTGGALTAVSTAAGGHAHTVTSGPHTLTKSELPEIFFRMKGSFAAGGYAGGGNAFFRIQSDDNYAASAVIEPVGDANPHVHEDGDTDTVAAHTHTVTPNPPHYLMVFIVKVVDYDAP